MTWTSCSWTIRRRTTSLVLGWLWSNEFWDAEVLFYEFLCLCLQLKLSRFFRPIYCSVLSMTKIILFNMSSIWWVCSLHSVHGCSCKWHYLTCEACYFYRWSFSFCFIDRGHIWWLGHSYMWSFDSSSGLFQFMVRVLVRIAASGGWPAWYDRSYLLLPGIYHLIEIMPMKWRHPWANNVSKSTSLKFFTCRFDPTGSLWSDTMTIFGADHAPVFFRVTAEFSSGPIPSWPHLVRRGKLGWTGLTGPIWWALRVQVQVRHGVLRDKWPSSIALYFYNAMLVYEMSELRPVRYLP